MDESPVAFDVKDGLTFWHLIGMVQGGVRGFRLYKKMLANAAKTMSKADGVEVEDDDETSL